MNPQPVLRPNVVQSSPSPTSIIASINQSNYLCSQTPDTQSTSTPQIILNKDDVFQHPGKTNIVGLDKQSQFKQVYIIQKPKNSNTDTENINTQNQSLQSYTIVNGLMDVSYKLRQDIETQSADKQEKYDLKNLAINGHIPKISNMQMYQQLNRTEIYSNQYLKVDNYPDGKVRIFMPGITENVMRMSNLSHVFVNDPLREEYNRKGDPECAEKKSDTNTFTRNTDNKEPSTECRYESKEAK